jgi:hypothetical protein
MYAAASELVSSRRKPEATYGFALIWKIDELSNEDIKKHAEVIGVEVLLSPRCCKKQVQHLEYQELHAQALGCILWNNKTTAVMCETYLPG